MNFRYCFLSGLMSLATPVFPAIMMATGPESADHDPDAGFLSDQMTEFMNSNNLELRVRAVEFGRDNKGAVALDKKNRQPVKRKKDKEGADALGVQLNFQSGWYANMVGFDASLYTIGDLHSPYKKTRDLLLTTGNGNHTGYSKLGQAYIKARMPDGDHNKRLLTFKVGRERIYTGLIAGSGSRAAPSSWRGIDIDGEFQGLKYGLAWVDQVSRRDSSNFDVLKSFRKKGTAAESAKNVTEAEKIKYVWGADLAYSFMGLSLAYKDSHAKDFLFTYNLNASYNLDVIPGTKLTINGKYYQARKDGKLWVGTLWGGSPGYDKSANLKHMNIVADIGDLMLMLGYTRAEAKFTDPSNLKLGTYYYDFGYNTYGGFSLPTAMMIGNFFYHGEKALVAGVGYDFRELVPGLKAEASYTRGDGFNNPGSEKLRESEMDFDLKYRFQGPALDGFSFRFRYATYRPNGKLANGTDFANGKTDYRLYLDYRLKLF